jgi:hypothetical protein
MPSKSLEQISSNKPMPLIFDMLGIDDCVTPAALDQFMQATFSFDQRQSAQVAVKLAELKGFRNGGKCYGGFQKLSVRGQR